jgi:SAM-dependent methyltransferase
MATTQRRAPGVPVDYYRRIHRFEDEHFWYLGMRRIAASLLAADMERPGLRVLDAGCGTGGFLRWLADAYAPQELAGVDIAADAIEPARERLPEADLEVAPLTAIPFADASFDVVVTNDVLQHVPERDVPGSLRELWRVLVPGGALLVHTNGARRLRRERDDWRAYDAASLRAALGAAGFGVERLTYANALLSLWGAARGRFPHAPSETTDGIPQALPSRFVTAVGSRLLAGEARWLARRSSRLPYGHTLFALARKAEEAR